MNPTTASPHFLEIVQDDLLDVDVWLGRQLVSDHADLQPLLDRLRGFPGKRLRASQVLLVARSFGKLTPWHTALAGILEMVHCATLVHDDVLDEAKTRRGRPCLHLDFAWNEAILIGDWVYARALACSTDFEDRLCSRVLAEATARVCRGEIRQNLASGDFDLTEEAYLEMVDGKTSALFEAGCQLAAHYAGGDSLACKAAARHGLLVGRAFQIADDLLDLEGTEDGTGKTLGTDWAGRKITLPTLRLRDSLSVSEREVLRASFGSTNAIRDLCAGRLSTAYQDACASSREFLRHQLTDALVALKGLPQGEHREALVALTNYCGDRKK